MNLKVAKATFFLPVNCSTNAGKLIVPSSDQQVFIKQQCHHSNSKKKYEDPKVPAPSHSNWYYTSFENYNEKVDVVLECKRKERALFKYINDFGC